MPKRCVGAAKTTNTPDADTRLHELGRCEAFMVERVILITGAGQRLGAATAARLMDEGCHVLVHARSSVKAAQELVDEATARNGVVRGTVVQADLTVDEEI